MKKLMLPLVLLLSQSAFAKIEMSGFITPSIKFGGDSASDSYEQTFEMIDAGITFEGEIKENLTATVAILADQENLDDASAFSLIDEAYFSQQWQSRLSLKAGRSYINFGNYDTALISDPATLIFGEVQTNLIELGHTYKGFNYSIYAYNTASHQVEEGEKAGINAYGVSASYEVENYTLGASYVSNIAPSSSVDLDDTKQLQKQVGAYALYGKIQLQGFGIYASYMQGTDDFDLEDASYLSGTKKFNPMALNVETTYAHELMGKEWTFALSYQKQKGLTDGTLMPSTILLAGLNIALDENTQLALEYRHAMDEKQSDGGATDEKKAAKTTLAYKLSF